MLIPIFRTGNAVVASTEPRCARTVELEEEPPMSDPKPDPKPHTVPAGVLDTFLGNKGPNGELMNRGEPALVTDLPADADDDDD
jgi:hypothetical protein